MIKFTTTHEWVHVEDKIATIGITDHAQKELGDIVYVELPLENRQIHAEEVAVVLESTKAAVDVYSPLSGTIVNSNSELHENPEKINLSAEKEGWLYKLKLSNPDELDQLLDENDYLKLIQTS